MDDSKLVSKRQGPWVAALSILLCLFTAACSESMNETEGAEAQADQPARQSLVEPAPAPVDAGAAAGIETQLRKGMAYGSFRGLVLGAGWEPVVHPGCRANVVGADAEAFCAANPGLVNCRICDELPELQSCSNDARCLVRFRHGDGRELEARAYGEVEYWSETGDDAGLQVTDWEFMQPAQQ